MLPLIFAVQPLDGSPDDIAIIARDAAPIVGTYDNLSCGPGLRGTIPALFGYMLARAVKINRPIGRLCS